MTRKRKLIWVALLASFFEFSIVGTAQGLPGVLQSGGSNENKPAPTPSDPLGRSTPRSSFSNFLDNCHRGGLATAAQYLDLSGIRSSERKEQGGDLARTLCIAVNRDSQFELRHLNDTARGVLDDGLEQDRDLLAEFQVNDASLAIYLQRENQNGMDIWLVSADSVARIPQLEPLTQATAFEQWLPAPLVKLRFIGTSVWVWIVLFVIALILGSFSRLLSRGVLAALNPFVAGKTVVIHRIEALIEPVRLIVAVVLFRIAISFVPTSVRLRQYLLYLMGLLFVIGVAALVMRITDVIADRIQSRLNPNDRAVSLALFRLSARFIKFCIFSVAVLFLLHQWGFKVGAVLAGLGVGGLAVALAAQKTLENLISGISVISDRPVAVGEFCLFSGPRGIMVGTVVDVGLRSTRIKTLFRTIVTIPNGMFANMQLENFTSREMMWFHPTLQLSRSTPPAKIRAMMDAITKILEDHPLVDPTDVPLRFAEIKDQSYQLEIFSYVTSSDYNKFLNIRSELLLKFLEAGEALGVSFAVPFYEITSGKQLSNEAASFFSHQESSENGNTRDEHSLMREKNARHEA